MSTPGTVKVAGHTVRVLFHGVWVDSISAPNHGPWHRDAKHVARLLARWRDVVRERTRPRGTVHEGVLVTG